MLMAATPKSTRRILAAVLLSVIGSVALHFASYHYSPEVTACDFSLTTEEGLIAAQFPLVEHDDKLPYVDSVYIYRRENGQWKIPDTLGGKTGVRGTITLLNSPPSPGTFSFGPRADGALYFDFGYIKYPWYRPERPGESIVLVVPMWTLFLLFVLAFSAFELGYIKFSIKTLLALTAIVAILVWLAI